MLENQIPYSHKVKSFLLDCMYNGAKFYTSTITDAEFIVKPMLEKNFTDIEIYKDFLHTLNVLKSFVSESIAESSAKLRSKYPSIKLPDAIQLAVAMDANCDAFLTNDAQLKQVIEANVEYLGDL